jgi:hypothetical protein
VTVDEWLAWAQADAARRGLTALGPILEGLAKATVTLRAGDWNEAADEPVRDDDPETSA